MVGRNSGSGVILDDPAEGESKAQNTRSAPPAEQRARKRGAPWRLGIGMLAVIVMLAVASIKESGHGAPSLGPLGASATPLPAKARAGLPLIGDLFQAQPRSLEGTVVDARTTMPLAGARVEGGGQAVTADATE